MPSSASPNSSFFNSVWIRQIFERAITLSHNFSSFSHILTSALSSVAEICGRGCPFSIKSFTSFLLLFWSFWFSSGVFTFAWTCHAWTIHNTFAYCAWISILVYTYIHTLGFHLLTLWWHVNCQIQETRWPLWCVIPLSAISHRSNYTLRNRVRLKGLENRSTTEI